MHKYIKVLSFFVDLAVELRTDILESPPDRSQQLMQNWIILLLGTVNQEFLHSILYVILGPYQDQSVHI